MYSMKDTNLRWIGAIPEDWRLEKVKHSFYLSKEKAHENNPTVLTLARSGVRIRDISNNEGQMAESYYDYNPVRPGDLLLNPMDLYSGDNCNVSHHYGVISPAYANLRSLGYANPEYYNYFFKIQYLIMALFAHGKGVSQDNRWTLNNDALLNYYIPVPPREEQNQIVRYLDWQTSKINKLIHGYQREIKLLEERKLTIVNDAVVHGINSTAFRVLTKAEWMGLVPDTWCQMRMKNFFTEINVRSLEGKEPHLSMSQKKGLVTDEENIGRPLLSESYAGAKLCERDDLVLNRLKAHLGVFALAPIKGIVSPDYTVLRLNRKIVVPKYAELLLKSNDCRKELRIRVRGIVEGFWRLYTEDLGSIPVCIPSLEEQEAILSFIEDKTAPINVVINRITQEIDLLKEYRTRLISDVVTGQMDVRGIEIPDYTPEDDIEDSEAENETADEEVDADAE